MRGELTSRQISEAGRLLVRYKLFLQGIEATPASQRESHHLEAVKKPDSAPITIEVHTNWAPKPAGGKGRPALAWMLDGKGCADVIAAADLSTDRVWLFRTAEAYKLAQQHPDGGGHHLIMVTDHGLTRSKHDRIRDSDFDDFRIEGPRLPSGGSELGSLGANSDRLPLIQDDVGIKSASTPKRLCLNDP